MLNALLDSIPPSPTVSFADKIRRLARDGYDIVPLHTGDPDFTTPDIVLLNVQRALRDGLTHYCESRGLPELRFQLAAKLRTYNNIDCNPDEELLVTLGGIHGYYCALMSIINPGDEVLIPEPTWPSHFNIARLLGARVVAVPTSFDNNYIPDLDVLRKSITRKTKAMVLSYPSNPTGAVPTPLQLSQLVEFAIKNDLWIISDEVYEYIRYSHQKHISAATFSKAKTISIFSCSKTYAMTGWRIGYAVGPKDIISRMLKCSQYMITNVPPFLQKAMAMSINTDELNAAVDNMVSIYKRRSDLVADFITAAALPISFHKPAGAFYYFLDFSATHRSSIDLANSLLLDGLVAMVPGDAYGSSGEGKLRMTIAASEGHIIEGLTRTANWLRQL